MAAISAVVARPRRRRPADPPPPSAGSPWQKRGSPAPEAAIIGRQAAHDALERGGRGPDGEGERGRVGGERARDGRGSRAGRPTVGSGVDGGLESAQRAEEALAVSAVSPASA